MVTTSWRIVAIGPLPSAGSISKLSNIQGSRRPITVDIMAVTATAMPIESHKRSSPKTCHVQNAIKEPKRIPIKLPVMNSLKINFLSAGFGDERSRTATETLWEPTAPAK